MPLHGLFATRKEPHEGVRFLKPQPGMWEAMEEHVNQRTRADPGQSFFVGDMAGRPNDLGNSDREWAKNVGASRGVTMPFQTPEETFGPPAGPSGNGNGGAAAAGGGASAASLPRGTLLARAALLLTY